MAYILRRHPAFDKDFANKMPADVASADKATQDHWIFQHAATWPDVGRRGEYDRPTWHYVNFPLALAGRMVVTIIPSTDYPTQIERGKLNVAQAAKHWLAALKSGAGMPGNVSESPNRVSWYRRATAS